MSLELLAQQELSTTAVEALIAELRVISAYTLTNCKPLDVFPDGSNNTNSFVPY